MEGLLVKVLICIKKKGLYLGNYGQKYLLGITIGAFLYMALANMIPEILKEQKKSSILGVIFEVGAGLLGAYLILILH